MKKFLTPFQNIKLNIILFAAIALASIFGTLIPQIPENPGKVEAFIQKSPQLGEMMNRVQLFNIYYSWWFIGMLGLMAFNVIVCKLIFGKFPGFNTFKNSEQRTDIFYSLPMKSDEIFLENKKIFLENVGIYFKNKKYAIQKIDHFADGKVFLLASKHRMQRYGSWISHVSILLVLLANFTGALYGFREVLNIPEETSVKMQNRPWVIACDQFTIDWYANSNTPKTFASQLRLFDRGHLVKNQKIVVNEPLEYKKTRFYQATYGPYLKEARIGVFLRQNPKQSPTVMVRLNEDSPVPGTPYSLRILQFSPDFQMDEKMNPGSKSALPNNPALQILVSKNGKPYQAPWIFQHFPGMHMPPIKKEDDFILILADYVPAFSTGIQVMYDPGADLFWLACAILVSGLMLLFYLHHRKIWILVYPSESKQEWNAKVGAYSSRGKSFESDFSDLELDLKKIAGSIIQHKA